VLLASPPTDIVYNFNTIVTTDANVNCGTPTLVFKNFDGTAYDTSVFSENRDFVSTHKFTAGAGPLSTISKAGDYELKFEFYYSKQAGNRVTSDKFIVVIVDECDPHNSYPQPVLTATTQIN